MASTYFRLAPTTQSRSTPPVVRGLLRSAVRLLIPAPALPLPPTPAAPQTLPVARPRPPHRPFRNRPSAIPTSRFLAPTARLPRTRSTNTGTITARATSRSTAQATEARKTSPARAPARSPAPAPMERARPSRRAQSTATHKPRPTATRTPTASRRSPRGKTELAAGPNPSAKPGRQTPRGGTRESIHAEGREAARAFATALRETGCVRLKARAGQPIAA
jgi:hypothetical protein